MQDQGRDGLWILKKICKYWEYDGGESNVKKEQNGRESMRRLKPTVGCGASKRRRRRRRSMYLST
jgi:hypothetical protein